MPSVQQTQFLSSQNQPVVFDLDNTITKRTTVSALLKVFPPNTVQTRKIQELLIKWQRNKSSTEQINLDYVKLLSEIGINKKQYSQAVEEVFNMGLIRPEFIEAVQYLVKTGRKCYIASSSPKEFIQLIANELNRRANIKLFQGVIGSIGLYDSQGRLKGAKLIIGDKNGWKQGVRTVTKAKALKNSFGINLNQAVFFSDNFADMKSNAGHRIYITPAEKYRMVLRELNPNGIIHTKNRKSGYIKALIKLYGRFPITATKNIKRTRQAAKKLSTRKSKY
ncbi:MAG: HAD family hydrolase [archaeon]|jgi:phosphoserine phosphatase